MATLPIFYLIKKRNIMPVTIKTFGDEPYILATYATPFLPEDFAQILKITQEISDRRKAQGVPHKVWYVVDTRQIKMTFDDLVDSLSLLRKLDSTAMQAVIVGSSEMVELAVKAAQQKQYGSREEAKIFDNLDEALEYAKAQQGK
jgi:hypothetical protein